MEAVAISWKEGQGQNLRNSGHTVVEPTKGPFTLLHFLRQTVVFLQGDRKFPISALTQPTAENADRCILCESALNNVLVRMWLI